ncbi:hypothetical protein D3P05_23910 [Paracoccus siganidrum]|uniref:Uncharacterized protein n=2 Tax=Paracoccus siganidrum TaxID=1276757 RepID=A0A418ZRB3_9RHOB|nr:hypothetical protein D3P05_23910 [Paracoccus siganidrum]
MAFHGQKAFEYQAVHSELPEIARAALVSSGNAYLSHYTHVHQSEVAQGRDLTLQNFLSYFGIRPGAPVHKIENRMTSLLNDFGISIITDIPYELEIFKRIAFEKRNDPKILIEHDARVCTYIKGNDDKGYVLATWDKIMIDIVEGLSRVYADNPARVIDFLSIANGINDDDDVNYDMLTSLIHMDERKSAALASAIEKLKTAEQGYQVRILAEQARSTKGPDWELTAEDIYPLLDAESESTA